VVDVRAPENPVPIATLPTPTDRDFCASGTFGPHNLHENRPGSFRSEEGKDGGYLRDDRRLDVCE
jgi:hypothetical protein